MSDNLKNLYTIYFKDANLIYEEYDTFGKYIINVDNAVCLDSSKKIPFDDKKYAFEIIVDLFNSTGINFFITHGTCLGAIRNNNFIEYDNDLDFGMFEYERYKLFLFLGKLDKINGFKIYKISTDESSVSIRYNNLIIDITIYKNNEKYFFASRSSSNMIPNKFLKSLDKIYFMERTVNIPCNTKKFLEFLYGKNWIIPIKDFEHHKYTRYIGVDLSDKIVKTKKLIKKSIKYCLNTTYAFKNFVLAVKLKVLNEFDIKAIKSIKFEEIGNSYFFDSFKVIADGYFLLKIFNKNKYDIFMRKIISKNVEPIFIFNQQDIVLMQVNKFNKANDTSKARNINNMIIIPTAQNIKPISFFINDNNFFNILKCTILKHMKMGVSSGNFCIDNIMIDIDCLRNPNIIIYNYEFVFSDYLSNEEQIYFDIFYLFAKMQTNYRDFFDINFIYIKEFINVIFSKHDKENILLVYKKTKKFFYYINRSDYRLFDDAGCSSC